MSVALWLNLIACLTAGFCDVRTRRIPNALTGSLAIAAIAVHAFGGWRALLISLAVMAVLTIGGTLLYSRGGIGGGDIKLAVTASGMLSYPLCVPFLLYSAIGGGALAVIFLLTRGGAKGALSRGLLLVFAGGQGLAAEKRETLPYAVAFALGAILVALAQTVAPFLRITL
jgi:prepilin peptidase CpaA